MDGDDPRGDVLTSFYAELLDDLSRGASRPIEQYIERHPGHAELIRAEYANLLAQARADNAREVSVRERPAADRPTPAPSHSTSSPASETSIDSPSMQLVRALSTQSDVHRHYEQRAEIARGGMGAIMEVWDEHMRRALAMKVMLRTGARASAMFIEEAQVTGRLDHPGIVPVHELGMGSDGRLYFTMRLVKGQTLKNVIDLMRDGDAEWTQTHVLDVLLKVCDAMAYAHSKGVVHRDLKPANIMVGRFGEVYVMDWGLARVLGTRDRHDLRLRSAASPESSIHTLRGDEREDTPDSPLITMDGEIMGTPAYMSPEQADGRIDELGPRSDVYAVGAMLYHVLTGRMPYTVGAGRATGRTVLAMLLLGPPHPVHGLEPKAPLELVAICEKAMSRDAARRYADMQEMAADLRAYVEHRVVRAYETGAVAELKKWVRRNPALATSMLTVLVLAIAIAIVQYKGKQEAEREREKALAYADRVSVLSDTTLVAELEREAQHLWPIHPRTVPAIDHWLTRAAEVLERAEEHGAKLIALRARALPYSEEDVRKDAESDPVRETVNTLEGARRDRIAKKDEYRTEEAKQKRLQESADECERLLAKWKPQLGRRRTWRFADSSVQDDHDERARLSAALESFTNPDPTKGTLAYVKQRRERVLVISSRSIDDHRAAWDSALESISDPKVCPAYAGLKMKPQVGLVPLGRDPDSGLAEFALLESGDIPARGPDNHLVLTDDMALVLVLLPGGEFYFGAQKTDKNAPNYDEHAVEDEAPVRKLPLRPFFASKFEMTQAQWTRMCQDPEGGKSRTSAYNRFNVFKGPLPTARHPVEVISWTTAVDLLSQLDLKLPSEAQWEYLARAGTTTPWFTGEKEASLFGYANLPDKSAVDADMEWAKDTPWANVYDGYPFTAPVGMFKPNAFGLYDVCGNVSEWCRDTAGSYADQFDPKDGSRPLNSKQLRTVRGGSYFDLASSQRSAKRNYDLPDTGVDSTGVRPVRAIEE